MKQKIIQNIKAIILGLVVTLGVGYAAASFSGPGCAPPGCNADAPINASSTAQVKLGPLTLGGLGVVGNFKFLSGASAVSVPGQVLTALDAAGTVGWGAGGGGLTITGDGIIPATSGSVNLGKNWDIIFLDGTYVAGDAASANGYVYRLNGVQKIAFSAATGYSDIFNLTTTRVCSGSGSNTGGAAFYNHSLCGKLDTNGDLILETGASIKLAYVKAVAGGSSSVQATNKYTYAHLDDHAQGNAGSIISIVGILEPGTYTVSGRLFTSNDGGGGWAGVFLDNRSDLTITASNSKLDSYYGVPATGGATPNYGLNYNDISHPDTVFVLKRNGSNDGDFRITDRTITVTERKYIYSIVGQASMKGNVIFR